MRSFCLLIAGCGSLPPPGTCDVATTGTETVEVVPVALGAPARFDDLRFSPALGKLIVPPDDTGLLFLVEPDTLAVQTVEVPRGVGSADATATTIYAADRSRHTVIAIDPVTFATIVVGDGGGDVDYVRASPTTDEVWTTNPARNRLEILDARSLARIGSVILPGPPEGLTFDGAGRVYANTLGSIIAVDVAHRVVVGEWDRGCTLPHGFPQIDEEYGLAFGGCFANGGAGVVTTAGDLRAGFEAGGGEAVLAYEPTRHHLYLRGDPSPTLHILAVCPDGGLGELASVEISDSGHTASADDRGHVWVADTPNGGVLRITDPFAGSN